MRKLNSGFGYIEIFLVLIVISFIFYKVIDCYYRTTTVNKETKEVLATQGIDTTNYQTIETTTRAKIDAIQKQHLKELEDLK